MEKNAYPRALALSCLIGCTLIACTSPQHRVFQQEAFTAETPFQYYSNHDPAAACEISKRALLSQGYQLDDSKPMSLKAEKFFQPQAEKTTKLTVNLVCLDSSLGAVIYANALEAHYELKSHGTSAGVSVAALGSISLPWTADKDQLVKVGEETIVSHDFYRRLFDLIKSLDS